MEKRVISHWPVPPATWPAALQAEFIERAGDGRVGCRLVSQTERVRVWMISLAPGERIAFHTHVLDYFWTCTTGGAARSNYSDGRTVDVTYAPGETRHMTFDPGAFMIHDLQNTGPDAIVFTTVEFLDSANQPLPLPAEVLRQTSAAA